MPAPAAAGEWSKPVTVGEDTGVATIQAGMDRRGRAALLWDSDRGLVYASCSSSGRCGTPAVVGPRVDGATLAVTPSGRTYVLTTADRVLAVRGAPTPVAALGPARSIDMTARPREAGWHPPVAAVTARGHVVLAWQRRGSALMLTDVSVEGRALRVARNGRPGAVTGDARGNLLLVWARPGEVDDTALVTRIAPDGELGRARVLSDEIDYSFPDLGGAEATLLASGRAVVDVAASYLEPSTSGESIIDFFGTSASPDAPLVSSQPDVFLPAVRPAGDDRAVLAWGRDPGIATAFAGADGLGKPIAVTKAAPTDGFGTEQVAGADGAALIAWAAGDRRLMTSYLAPRGARFAKPTAVPAPGADDGRTIVQNTVPVLRPSGRGAAMVVFTVNRPYPEDFDPPPPDVVRVAFR